MDFALGLLAKFDTLSVRKVEGLFIFIQVDEVRRIRAAQGFDDFPGIVLRNCHAVQLHHFGSEMTVRKSRLT